MAYKKFKKDGTPAKKPGKKPDPNKPPKQPSMFVRNVPRPHIWKCGPDEYKHQMYQPWLLAKAQANFRNEEWNLPFEDYFAAWDGLWEHRGRMSDDLCMTRIEYHGPWQKDNIVIVTRKEHCGKQAEWKSRHNNDYKQMGWKKPGRKSKGIATALVYKTAKKN